MRVLMRFFSKFHTKTTDRFTWITLYSMSNMWQERKGKKKFLARSNISKIAYEQSYYPKKFSKL